MSLDSHCEISSGTRQAISSLARLELLAKRVSRSVRTFPALFLFAKTFNEKVQRRKILDRDPRLSMCSDKVLVKDFVAKKSAPDWTTPTIWHGHRYRSCTRGFGRCLSC